ncbi:MAG: citrate synthase [Leptospiraceae bacterium]|nr:citrate synthase [Leptospiraceae bacterium]MCP5496883.1 citrate synthase [Leptospiraceae bacterium]
MIKKAVLHLDDKSYELPILTSNIGSQGIDIRGLKEKAGVVTVDPGFYNTAIGESSISVWNTNTGALNYRGYDVAELVKHSSFVETSYLLIYGKLPNKTELTDFSTRLSKHSLIHEDMVNLFDGFPGKAHPLAILSVMVMSLSSYYTSEYEESTSQGADQITRLLAKIRTISAYSYKQMIGQPFVFPQDKLPYCTNFLNMLFSIPAEPYKVPEIYDSILNRLWILYAEHGFNLATTTVYLLGSAQANLFASVSAGVSALWGSREGGHKVPAIEWIEDIIKNGGDYKSYLGKIKDGKLKVQTNVLGEPAYKVKSLRSILARELFLEFFKTQNIDPIAEMALKIDEYTSSDPFFDKNNLYPNIDFYSSVIFNSMGIPQSMFTLMQAIGKLPGWLAHWREIWLNKNYTKARPKRLYKGEVDKKYTKLTDRV